MNIMNQMFNNIGSGLRLQLSLENIVSADLTYFVLAKNVNNSAVVLETNLETGTDPLPER